MADQEAGGKVEQRKNTEARQRKRAATQEAGDKAEQEKRTDARQRKRAWIWEGAKTGIQPLGYMEQAPSSCHFIRKKTQTGLQWPILSSCWGVPLFIFYSKASLVTPSGNHECPLPFGHPRHDAIFK